jgi:vesicle-fusing ATPase
MLDPALLRPGRLEVKVEVGLPDSSGREQILRILIRTMASHGAVADDVRLDAVAEATKNFSGAELEGLINSATSFALERSMRAQAAESSGGGGEGGEQQTGESEVRVQMQDFDRALREVLPALSTHTARLAAMAPHGMSARGEAFARLHTTASRMTRRLVRGGARAVWGAAAGPPGQVTAALLTGRGGVGKSAVAATIAAASGAPLVQVLGPEAVVGQEEREVVRAVREAFADVWKSPVAILILDDLERLIGFTEGSGEHHRGVLTALQTLLKQRPPDGHRLLVLGTTSLAAHSLRALQLAGDAGAFQLALEVPPLDAQETRGILEAHPAVATTEVGGVLRMLAVGAAGVPVKHLLMLLEMAHENSRQDAEDADVADAATVTLEHVAECLQHMRAAGLLLPA